MPRFEGIAGDIRAWYDRYLDTFTSLAADERSDIEALLEFFGVPLVFISEDRYLALPTHDAVLGTAKTLIDQPRRASYARSTIHRLEVRPLTARAAFVDGVFPAMSGTNSSASGPPT